MLFRFSAIALHYVLDFNSSNSNLDAFQVDLAHLDEFNFEDEDGYAEPIIKSKRANCTTEKTLRTSGSRREAPRRK